MIFTLFLTWNIGHEVARPNTCNGGLFSDHRSSIKNSQPGQCFYNNTHGQLRNNDQSVNYIVRINEPKFNLKMHSVVKIDHRPSGLGTQNC